LGEASAKGRQANRAAADGFAANVLPIVRQLQATGVTTLVAALATALNAPGIPTRRGITWQPMTVRNLLKRGVGV
jgi:hypothetical protein